jgi:hypothetical protein
VTAARFDGAHQVSGKRNGALQKRHHRPAIIDLCGETIGERIDTTRDFVGFEKNAQRRVSLA